MFILSLSDENQAKMIDVFNSTSRYLDDLLNIDDIYFESIVGLNLSCRTSIQ